jgi:hypothetical protein
LASTLQVTGQFLSGDEAMNTWRLFWAVLLMVFAVCTGHAQIFGTVRGTVVDPQGAVISGATVTLKAHASAFYKTTRSDETGNFTFVSTPAIFSANLSTGALMMATLTGWLCLSNPATSTSTIRARRLVRSLRFTNTTMQSISEGRPTLL